MGWTELQMKSTGVTAAARVSAARAGDVRERVFLRGTQWVRGSSLRRLMFQSHRTPGRKHKPALLFGRAGVGPVYGADTVFPRKIQTSGFYAKTM